MLVKYRCSDYLYEFDIQYSQYSLLFSSDSIMADTATSASCKQATDVKIPEGKLNKFTFSFNIGYITSNVTTKVQEF